METMKSLIERATVRCGSRRELAKLLECSEANLSHAYAGRRFLTVSEVAKLSKVAGVDPCRLLALVAISREKSAEIREELEEAFFGLNTLGERVLSNTTSDGPRLSKYTLWRVQEARNTGRTGAGSPAYGH